MGETRDISGLPPGYRLILSSGKATWERIVPKTADGTLADLGSPHGWLLDMISK
jgi:hypothetical protein